MSLSALLGTSLALAMALLAVAVTYLSERRNRAGHRRDAGSGT